MGRAVTVYTGNPKGVKDMDAEDKVKNPVVRQILKQQRSGTDPQGSYTGAPLDPWEKPVQDADDL